VAAPTTARRVAFDVLRAVHDADAYANLTLPRLLDRSGLDVRDRALAAELAYGSLRTEGTLDHVLAGVTSRPLAQVEPAVLDVLRLGAYQLLFTRVPSHAAVSATAELARRVVGERAVGFVNAVLRRVAGQAGDLVPPDRDTDPTGHLAVTTSHPRWVVEAFRDALGGDLAETEQALQADAQRPEVHLVARPGRISRAELLAECAAAGLTAEPGARSPYAVRLRGGDPGRLPAVRSGAAGVQDEGSQWCALTALAALPAERDPVVVDLCAGPGGKAALLGSALADRGGGRLVAVELHPHRARLVAAALAGQGAVVVGDGTSPPLPARSADLVLVDAPCTGLGALRRRPEARWRRQPTDVAPLVTLQTRLLAAATDLVRPGGVVAYVICSPHPSETGDPVLALTSAREDVTVGRTEQLWTHRDGTDAMHLTLLHLSG
jgi:16S rRNA (cytosine967-C5)-methyltransferase